MSPRQGRAARAVERVGRWADFYTRDLPRDVAETRQCEVESDLYEQLTYSAHHGTSDRHIARSMQSRAARGAIADLTWRRRQIRAAAEAPSSATAGWFPAALLRATLVMGAMILLWGAIVLVRWSSRISQAPYVTGSRDLYMVVVAMAVCACGMLMLRRARTRWLGAFWLSASVYVLIECGFAILIHVSTSAAFAQDLLPGWAALEIMVSAGIMLFFIGAAIWWLPARGPATTVKTDPA